ncbi:hypothetical protein GMORB2_2365 [Geosmithia morbida]|uniref:Uncharacterized protein n=1 Tax=Geosmithia morbida TaxID=1094350 RepID=A0A9P4YSB1_9HYPO|nr:uncharacterized protein GMORB2_2365 [Geosmithia morbida]KAF4120879.1 hypothetical protein GMORB2_2365 [Geosmithia morbida]
MALIPCACTTLAAPALLVSMSDQFSTKMPPTSAVTEYTSVSLKPEAEEGVLVEGGPVAKQVDTILAHKGVVSVHYATPIEKPHQLWTFVEWESLDHQGGSRVTVAGFDKIIDLSAPQIKAHISPTVASIFNDKANPVVEVLNMSFPADIDASQKAIVESRWAEFVDKALSHPTTFGNHVQGWTIEDDVVVPGDEAKTGKIFVAFISWPSLNKHMEKRMTDEFKDNIALLRTLPGLIKMSMFHVQCTTKHA